MPVKNKFGCICLLKNDSSKGTAVELNEGEFTFGSGIDATIRIKLEDPALRPKHCTIEVNEDGFVSLHVL